MAGWIVLGCVAVLLAAILLRAAAFRPARQDAPADAAPIAIDEDGVLARMQEMIRCRTVSYADPSMEDAAAFEAFPALLKSLYPRIDALCGQERIGARGVLYRWPGRHSDRPSVFMAHYDVVPVDAAAWQRQPFDAEVVDGVLWGRGTLDTKGTLLGVMEAAERLAAEGFVPEQDVYLAFGGNEEIGGDGAPAIVAALVARGVKPAFVLDEGGAVVEGAFPGVKVPTAVIGTGEKGSMRATLRVQSAGGHASAPPPHTPIGLLARAACRIERRPFPFRLTPPARAMFDTLGRHSTFVYRIIFANLWCFTPLLNLICKKSGGEMNALVRTTCAFTQMHGSDAANVLPTDASVVANLRLVGGETVETARARLATVVGDDRVLVEAEGTNPSACSVTEGEPWERLSGAVEATWPGAIVSPYLMVAASDARHWAPACDAVYRFSAMALSKEQRGLIHGNDERVPVETLYTTIRFYIRLMRAC